MKEGFKSTIMRNFIAGLLLLIFSGSCNSGEHSGSSSKPINAGKGNSTGSNIVELDTSNLDSNMQNLAKDSIR